MDLNKLNRDWYMKRLWDALSNNPNRLTLMERAGYFDESFYDDPDWYLDNALTPIAKVVRNYELSDREPVVLVTTGGFSPVHRGHVAMMEAARKAVEDAGYDVVGGYFSPSHNEYVDVKKNGSAKRHVMERIDLLHRVVEKSDWLDVDPWEGVYCEGAVNFTEVVLRLESYLEKYVGRVKVVYVYGSDNVAFGDVFLASDSLAVYVGNLEYVTSLEDGDIRGRVLRTKTDYLDYSSTRVRNGETDLLDESIRDLVSNVGDGVYEVRDDVALASDNLISLSNRQLDQLKSIIEKYVGYDVEYLDISEQKRALDEWRLLNDAGTLVSLDVFVDGDVNVGYSRDFDVSSGQTRANGLVDRGTVINECEVDGAYWLVDDDTASGYTLAKVTERFGEAGYLGFVGLNDLVRDPGVVSADVVDLRDFVFGLTESGLCVGSGLRAMYALPYVNVVSRASIDPDMAMSFSKAIVQWNIALYEQVDIRVNDLDGGTVRFVTSLGFDVREQVSEVLRKMYRSVLECAVKLD